MGRLFDAGAELAPSGILTVAEYEGEAPLYVEQQARAWFGREGLDYEEQYDPGDLENGLIPTRALAGEIIADIEKGEPAGKIAAKFHNTLVASAAALSARMEIRKLAFSGGVFQNGVSRPVPAPAREKPRTLFYWQLSPNDECISFGQLAWYYIRQVMLSGSKENEFFAGKKI